MGEFDLPGVVPACFFGRPFCASKQGLQAVGSELLGQSLSESLGQKNGPTRDMRMTGFTLTAQRALRDILMPRGKKMTPHCLATIFDSQLPSPKLSLKMPPKLPLPPQKRAFLPLLSKLPPRFFSQNSFRFGPRRPENPFLAGVSEPIFGKGMRRSTLR